MYKAVFNDDGNYLVHYNKIHKPAGTSEGGQFGSGDGDGDGVVNDHAHRSEGSKSGLSSQEADKLAKSLNVYSTGAPKAMKNIKEGYNNRPKKQKKRMDLSEMSDKELQQALNRERMEREYNTYFNSPEQDKGQIWVESVGTAINYTAAIAGLAATALTIYSVATK